MQPIASVDLGGAGWRLVEIGGVGGPLPATVPGTVHTDLMKAGRIPDPHLGLNEEKVRWVAERDWSWSREFEVSGELLARDRVELVFEGLDTAARVLLNGEEVAESDNMYVPLRVDVKPRLRAGVNSLEVRIESPVRLRRQREEQAGLELRQGQGKAAAYLRKAPYSFFWDWGPELPTSGIWKPVRLEAFEARIADVWPRVELAADAKSAKLSARVAVESAAAGRAELALRLAGHGLELEVVEEVELAAGASTHEVTFEVESPELWWPNGYGDQPLYELRSALRAGGAEIDADSHRVGFRAIELVREPDERGESFLFRINGVPVFCRGANWIPDDSFLPRVTRERLERAVAMAAGAHMNMLRVWGGGVYESEDFYDLCDERGILVWQDFVFACGMYPDHLDWFRESVRREAEANVKRLRGRTCLALFCGNNECHQGWHEWGWKTSGKWDRFYGERLYHEVLPEVVSRLAPDTVYWPGSPWGGEPPNSQDVGDTHYWGVWHRREPAEGYESLTCRFLSEFGFESGPCPAAVREFAGGREVFPDSQVMLSHEKCTDGKVKLRQYLETEFGVGAARDLTGWIYRSQYVQAHCIGTALRHTRRRFPECGGVLFWQHNDCWPVTSWSCMDHRCRPKALWYQARRDFAPAACSVADREDRVSVWVVANRPGDAPAGDVRVRLLDFAGTVLFEERAAFAGGSPTAEAWSSPKGDLPLGDGRDRLLVADYLVGGELRSRGLRTFAAAKDQPLDGAEVEVAVEPDGAGGFEVRLSSNRVVLGLMLTADGDPSPFGDNFLYLLPGEPQTVRSTVGEGIELMHAGSP
ncbi:MAG: beta-mannosidase [Planctomycetota bacterium]|jgi:beta-mannosidase